MARVLGRGVRPASALLPVLLGAALGNVVRGVPLDAGGYFQIPLFTGFRTGNPVGILDWYTVLMGVLALATLAAHGALFLAWKTGGALQARCRRAALALWPAVVALALAATLATAWVAPALYRNLPHAPLAWAATVLFLAGLARVAAGLARERYLLAFLGSSAFIVGMLAATAACVWPVMLPSTLDPAASLTAYNGGSGPAGCARGSAGFASGCPWWRLISPICSGCTGARWPRPEEGQGYSQYPPPRCAGPGPPGPSAAGAGAPCWAAPPSPTTAP